MKKLSFDTPILVPSEDPSLARCFKQRPVVLDGDVVGYKSAKFTPDTMPNPDDVEPSDSDNLLDFGTFASVQKIGDSVDLPIVPAMNEMQLVDTAKNLKSQIK